MRRAFTTLGARMRSSHQSGNLYLVGALASAAGTGLLYVSERREVQQRRDLEQEFDNMLAKARVQAKEETAQKLAELDGKQALWTGTLTMVDHRLQGHMMLRGCRVGQEVDILEEHVGQEGKYVTVIDRKTGAFGWHLAEWVDRTRGR
mmetsp:Transcript_1888/g.5348  ORF Transcript_1888/g.5348 Transcript_1888/m.5348 type:complete len:148 (+) Transcript_1888:35-478(+)